MCVLDMLPSWGSDLLANMHVFCSRPLKTRLFCAYRRYVSTLGRPFVLVDMHVPEPGTTSPDSGSTGHGLRAQKRLDRVSDRIDFFAACFLGANFFSLPTFSVFFLVVFVFGLYHPGIILAKISASLQLDNHPYIIFPSSWCQVCFLGSIILVNRMIFLYRPSLQAQACHNNYIRFFGGERWGAQKSLKESKSIMSA